MRKIFKIGVAVSLGAALILGLGLGFGLRDGGEEVTEPAKDPLMIETENGFIKGQGFADGQFS